MPAWRLMSHVDELSGNRQTPVMQGLAMLKTAVWIPVCRFAPGVTGGCAVW